MKAILDAINNFGAQKLMVFGGVGLALIIGAIVVASNVSEPQMSLLYGGLEPGDQQAIGSYLSKEGQPYQIDTQNKAVLVPGDQVLSLRMKLAEEGLPAGSSVGYELLDNASALGTTAQGQKATMQRALEGELARTIRSLDWIASARVHLVVPERELFSRTVREPSASVVLKTRGGGVNPGQIKAIQHLVAAAVPNLSPARISIVDDKGNLLAKGVEDEQSKQTDLVNSFEQLRQQYENRVRSTIEETLEKSVGLGQVRVNVSADMNFDRVTTEETVYDPESVVPRSTQDVEETESTQDAETEVPVTVGANLPGGAAGNGGGNRSQSSSSRTESTVNNEMNKTTRQTTREGGKLNRIAVSVLVNHKVSVNPETNEKTYTPRTDQELQMLSQLVRTAIGFNGDRGDQVQVVNMEFAPAVSVLDEEEIFDIIGLTKDDILKLAEMLVLGIVAILVVLLVLRPLVARIIAMGEEAAEAAASLPGDSPALAGPDFGRGALAAPEPEESELEAMIDLDKIEGRVKASSVKKIGDIIDKHPEEAVAIIRTWLYES